MTSVITTASKAAGPITEVSPRLKARVAGVFYTITVVTSLFAFFPGRGSPLGHAAGLIAGAAYLVVALLLYDLLKPVSRSLSLLAALFSVVGIARSDDSIFFFGFYCVLLGYLIYKSTFFPRALGVLMALAGLGLLINAFKTLLPPALEHPLSVAGFTLDGGEIVFTLWLLVMGVNVQKWEETANRIGVA